MTASILSKFGAREAALDDAILAEMTKLVSSSWDVGGDFERLKELIAKRDRLVRSDFPIFRRERGSA